MERSTPDVNTGSEERGEITTHRGGRAERRALDAFIKLMRATSCVQARLEPVILRHGLTPSQFGVLEALLHLGPLHQQELATKLLVSKGNITLVVRNLARAGLVARSGSSRDRRKTVVALTPAGRRMIARLFPRHAAAIVRELSALSAIEQETLERLCRKLGLDPHRGRREAPLKLQRTAPTRVAGSKRRRRGFV